MNVRLQFTDQGFANMFIWGCVFFLEILSVVHYGTLDTCDGLLKLLTQLLLWFEAGIVAGIQIRNW